MATRSTARLSIIDLVVLERKQTGRHWCYCVSFFPTCFLLFASLPHLIYLMSNIGSYSRLFLAWSRCGWSFQVLRSPGGFLLMFSAQGSKRLDPVNQRNKSVHSMGTFFFQLTKDIGRFIGSSHKKKSLTCVFILDHGSTKACALGMSIISFAGTFAAFAAFTVEWIYVRSILDDSFAHAKVGGSFCGFWATYPLGFPALSKGSPPTVGCTLLKQLLVGWVEKILAS